MAFLCPGKVLDKCRAVGLYINTSPASPAPENSINTSPAVHINTSPVYINTSPAPEKCINTSRHGVYKYFSGAGEVYLNTTMAFFCPGKVLDKCRPIYKYFSSFSGAGEVYKYFSGTVYINTSPASRTP